MTRTAVSLALPVPSLARLAAGEDEDGHRFTRCARCGRGRDMAGFGPYPLS